MAEEWNHINEETPETEDMGEIKISEEVVLVVAGLAVGEVDGVSVANSLTDSVVEKFVRKNYGKGIRIEMTDKEVSVDVHVVVEYGIKIPDVAWELQETVKKNIETMTNLTVSGVNIFVEGIVVEREPKPDAKEGKRAAKEEKRAKKEAAKTAQIEEVPEQDLAQEEEKQEEE